MKRIYDFFNDNLFFNIIFAIYIEGYFDFAINGFLNL